MTPACEGIGLDMTDDVFFSSNKSDLHFAKRICRDCPLTSACLELALDGEKGAPAEYRHGVFGGTIPSERYRIEMTRNGGRKCADCRTSIEERPAIARRCVDCQKDASARKNRERMAARRDRSVA